MDAIQKACLAMFLGWIQEYKETLSYTIQAKNLGRWKMTPNQVNRAYSQGGENIIEMFGTAQLLQQGKTQADPPDFTKMLGNLIGQAPQQDNTPTVHVNPMDTKLDEIISRLTALEAK